MDWPLPPMTSRTGDDASVPIASLSTPASLRPFAQLTAGLAPPLNTLLTTITGRTMMLLDDPALDEQTRERLNEIYTAGERAVSLTRQLLFLSGRSPPQLRTLDLNALITQLTAVLQRSLRSGLTLTLQLAPGLRLVRADADMLEQILVALTRNASDAMPHRGECHVSTANVILTAAEAARHPGGRAGDFVTVSVADTGTGIAPEVLPRLFEPFVTTKPPGHGAGLGLAAAHSILQQHQGWLAVKSTPGAGTEFTVFFPAAPSGAVPDEPATRDDRSGLGHPTILFVEDDPLTREFTTAVLQDLGYRVLQAGTAADALETWKWHRSRIRLLLTDVVLDGRQSGLDLAAQLRAAAPGLGVIFTSGHGRAILDRAPALPGGIFLQKPFRPQALARALRTVLDTPVS